MIKIHKNMAKALENVRFIDLFAGIGGFRLALESYGAECVFSSEWDKYAQEVYEANFHETPHGDITKINETDIPAHDILCGGFPCQAFSISGKQRGFNDSRGTLFFDIARIAKHHNPSILFMENVKNFAKHDNGRTLEVIENILDELDYDVYHKVLNAGYYGVPQNRERIYIVCFKKSLKLKDFEFPAPLNKSSRLADLLLPPHEVKDCLKDYPMKLKSDLAMQSNIWKLPPNKPVRIGSVNKGGQGERIYHIEGHAITLSAYGGGVGAKTGLYLVGGKLRKLAARECARLMGLPDSFILHPNKNQTYKQMGNGVVVDVLQRIVKNIVKTGVFK